LRAQLGLKLPDAIHAATALAMGCTAILTNDIGFKRLPGAQLFLLSDWA
jgi:predicted nucleic acid-binding protein